MAELPTGTVTFLFTDIEGSTTLAQQYPAELPILLARHHAILRAAIEAHHGHVFQIIGDAFCAAFHTANDALQGALDAQRGLQHEVWNPAPLRVRMGLHTGTAQAEDDEEHASGYAGYSTMARTQRVMSIAYGGQVLLSNSTVELVRDQLPADVTLRDMHEHRLKGLSHPDHLWQLVAPGLVVEFPPLKTLTTIPNNLPLQLTSFVGREKESADIKGLLNSARLVTLTGSGGTGKTRLAQEVGAEELSSFANGVWLIELAPLSDPAQIVPALAQVLGLQELPFNPLANLVLDYLRDKKILLLLDNCEHLIEACARLANDLLHQCAGLKILASSREALGIAGEVAYRTPSLADSESTQLFVDRARAANSNFKLTDANTSAVAQICHRLDGIPLAIELAAARAKLLSAEQIAARLDDRFRLLVGGSRTALPRQQTLRALIDWSYDLLSEEEKRLLQFASVFVGGWNLDALEAVSEDPQAIEHLEGLVNKSLVVTEERGSEMRYFMLETIRQYAREKLFDAKQAAVARDRHFVYFDKLSDGLWNVYRIRGEFEIERHRAIRIEMDNLRAALEWGLQNNLEETLNLAANIAMSLGISGGQLEGIAMLKVVLEKFRTLPPSENDRRKREELLMRACFCLGTMSVGSGDIVLSRSALQEAIQMARQLGDQFMLGYSLEMYSNASIFIKAEDSLSTAQEGLEIITELNDTAGLAMAYSNIARWAAINGNYDESQKYLALLQEISRDIPVSFQSGILLLGLASNARFLGQLETAKKQFETGLKMFEHVGHKGFMAVMTAEIAHVERAMGNYSSAKNTYRETIKVFQDHGNRPAVAHQLECFAMIAVVEEEPQRAAKLFGAADAIREVTGHKPTDEEEAEETQFMSRLHAMLSEAEFTALWAEGRSMTMEQAIQLALG
jgi:predicted ATPase/class 3 adenylate cyclase